MLERRPFVSPMTAPADGRARGRGGPPLGNRAVAGAGAAVGAIPQPPARGRVGLDLTTVLGLFGGFALVGVALVLGGSFAAFFNLPAAFIVVGGTFAVTVVSFAPADAIACLRYVGHAIARPVQHPTAVAVYVLHLAEQARRSGPLSLQPVIPEVAGQPLLQRALELIVDGLPAEDVERILKTEIEADLARARAGAAVLRRAAEVAPAMGLIGTLVGLVQMLGNLTDPGTIGPAMAVALLTTFYGAIMGSMVLAPLAGKVERNADAQALVESLYLLAAASVARQENPRRLEMMINTVLPPEHRLSTFD